MHVYCPEGYFLSNERTVYVPHSLLRQCSGLKDVPHITFDHHSRIARDVQYSSTVPLSLLYRRICYSCIYCTEPFTNCRPNVIQLKCRDALCKKSWLQEAINTNTIMCNLCRIYREGLRMIVL